jgi:hypothetical protein
MRKEGGQEACTAEEMRRFPGLEVVSHCPWDGMPIYRRGIKGAIATELACPDCQGREGERR